MRVEPRDGTVAVARTASGLRYSQHAVGRQSSQDPQSVRRAPRRARGVRALPAARCPQEHHVADAGRDGGPRLRRPQRRALPAGPGDRAAGRPRAARPRSDRRLPAGDGVARREHRRDRQPRRRRRRRRPQHRPDRGGPPGRRDGLDRPPAAACQDRQRQGAGRVRRGRDRRRRRPSWPSRSPRPAGSATPSRSRSWSPAWSPSRHRCSTPAAAASRRSACPGRCTGSARRGSSSWPATARPPPARRRIAWATGAARPDRR